jgi:hypothetical protein
MKPVVHQYEDKLLELAYGELPANEESAVSAHVKTCAKCSEALAGIKGVRASMRQLPVEQPSEAGLDSLLAYAEQAARRNSQGSAKKRGLFSKWVGALSAVAAVSVIGYVTVSASMKTPDLAGAVTAAKQAELKSGREEEASDRQRALDPNAAPEPAPAVAAAPKPTPAKDSKADEGELAKLYGRSEGTGTGSSMPSLSRRDKSAKNTVSESDEGLLGNLGSGGGKREDFSNATARGAREPAQAYLNEDQPAEKPADDGKTQYQYESKPSTPPKVAAQEKKSMGLSSSDLANKKADGLAGAASQQVPAGPQAAPLPPMAASPQRSNDSLGASSGTLDSAAQRQSMGLSVKSKPLAKSAPAASGESNAVADELATSVESRVSARLASKAGDRQGEVNAALSALKNGATGYQRTEALKRLCDAFEADGDEGMADTYCGMLLKEFPNTVEAKTVVTRRAMLERAAEDATKKAGAKSKAKSVPSEAIKAK